MPQLILQNYHYQTLLATILDQYETILNKELLTSILKNQKYFSRI
jgi:hypothetical protein